MATKGEMVRALAERFDLNPNKVDALTRAMAKAGLRSPGGRGRAATHMSGEDIFHVTLALVMNLETKDAPEIVKGLSQLKLEFGDLWLGDHNQWDAYTGESRLLTALDHLPVAGLKLFRTFGSFCGHWLDGEFNESAAGFGDAKASVEVSTNGPHAVFSHQSESGDLRVWFGAVPKDLDEPEWERRVSMSDKLFRGLSVLASGGDS